jgi:hypothetical protein
MTLGVMVLPDASKHPSVSNFQVFYAGSQNKQIMRKKVKKKAEQTNNEAESEEEGRTNNQFWEEIITFL